MMDTPQKAAERLTASLGKLVRVYEYRDLDGTPVFWNLRIATPESVKTFPRDDH